MMSAILSLVTATNQPNGAIKMTHQFTTRNDVRTYINNCQFGEETSVAAERALWARHTDLNDCVHDAETWHALVREILCLDRDGQPVNT